MFNHLVDFSFQVFRPWLSNQILYAKIFFSSNVYYLVVSQNIRFSTSQTKRSNILLNFLKLLKLSSQTVLPFA